MPEIREPEAVVVLAWVALSLLVLLVVSRSAGWIGGLRRAEASLRLSQAQLMEAQRIAQVGSFETDLVTGVQTGSPQMYRLFGLEPAAQVDLPAVLALVHPDDRQEVDALLTRVLEGMERYEIVIRVLRPDGESRILLCRGEVVRDASGRAIKLVGTNQDVTDARRSRRPDWP